jgi:hypothetical protein
MEHRFQGSHATAIMKLLAAYVKAAQRRGAVQ